MVSGPYGDDEGLFTVHVGGSHGFMRRTHSTIRAEETLEVYEMLEKLVEGVTLHVPRLRDLRQELHDRQGDVTELSSIVADSNDSAAFIHRTSSVLSNTLMRIIDQYLSFVSSFERRLKDSTATSLVIGRLRSNGSSADGDSHVDPDDGMGESHTGHISPGDFDRVASTVQSLGTLANTIYGLLHTNSKGGLIPRLVNTAHSVKIHLKYLEGRFTEPEDPFEAGPAVMMIKPPGDDEEPDYVKVRLVDDNPVLTDILLKLEDHIPPYKEVGKGKGKRRFVSEYAVNRVAGMLRAFGTPSFLDSVLDVKDMFRFYGGAVEELLGIVDELEDIHTRLYVHHSLSDSVHDEDALKATLASNVQSRRRYARDLVRADFDAVVQDPTAVEPDNARERRAFSLRDRIFDILVEGLHEMRRIYIPNQDPGADAKYDEAVYQRAREVVLETVELKSELDDSSQDTLTRRISKDRREGNEYYVGSKEGFGEFIFVREPAPSVTMDDVRGASFDSAKEHLGHVIRTAVYSRVMRVSSPRGKLKNGVMLIGPPGCGKTELARAVGGDPRAIGAVVDISSVNSKWVGQSETNVRLLYDEARELYIGAEEEKPVFLTMDEFEGWFDQEGYGGGDANAGRVETILLQMMDGPRDYSGIVTLALTNNPKLIPPRVMRRFQHVYIVGELTTPERANLLKMFLENGMPVDDRIEGHYMSWAEQLQDAPGDVVATVADRVHMDLIPVYLEGNPRVARRVERTLRNRERRGVSDLDNDRLYVKRVLSGEGVIVTPDRVDVALERALDDPGIQRTIGEARDSYRDAHRMLAQMRRGGGAFAGHGRMGFGVRE